MYKSADLQVTKLSIEGYIMKAIENASVFHSGEYHKRYFKLEFGQAECHFYESHKKSKQYKSHKQAAIVSCTNMEESAV